MACFAVAALLAACNAGREDPPAGADEPASVAEAVGSSSRNRNGDGTVRRAPGLDVLLITVDTLRADALGAYGNPRRATPWMDRLAASGVRFDDAHAHNVVTLPSHATILSGLHPHEHGVRDNSGFRFPAAPDTLATLLSARGYRTGAFISAFPLDSRFGLDRGFDLYEDSFVDAGSRRAFLEQERTGADTVALAVRWLEAAGETPWLAWVHLYEPHFPYAPPSPFDRRFADDPYLGEVAAVDAILEPLLAPILEAGAGSDTLVVLTSDHGEGLGEHGEATHGVFAYESTLAVPLILHQPRLLEPRVVASPARLVDLLPTILDLLGEPEPQGIAGRSLAPTAVGAGAPVSVATYFEALSGQLNRGWAPIFGVIRDRWKYIQLPIPELYDLRSDRREERNLADREPVRVEELAAELTTLRSADSGPAPAPEDAETVRRLRDLGYVGGGGGVKETYTAEDDPKRLIGLDTELREINGLYAAGQLGAARSRCRDLLRRRPEMRLAIMTLAQIESDLGNLDAAIEAMRRALALYPEDASALAALVSYLTRADRAREAAELSAPHAAGARPDVDVLFMRSLALGRLGRPGEALTAIGKAGEVDPGNPMVAVYRGTVRLMGGQRREARTAFEEAVALNPDTVRAHTSLAVMATEEGRFEEALKHWHRAVFLDPREHAKLLAVAGGLWQTGRQAEARPLLELFAASAPPASFGAELERVRGLLAAAGS
jgi:arylsulfatase A-like enzyme/Tfp pilus assembly protein PilF